MHRANDRVTVSGRADAAAETPAALAPGGAPPPTAEATVTAACCAGVGPAGGHRVQISPIRATPLSPTMLATVRQFCTSRPGRTPRALMTVSARMPPMAYLRMEYDPSG